MAKKGRLVSLLVGLVIAGVAQGAIVDRGDYLTDTSTGLDWLDVTKTVNMSFDQVTVLLAPGGEFAGWRYATGSEFLVLASNYSGLNFTDRFVFYGSIQEHRTDGLVSLLGATNDEYYLRKYGMTYDEYNNPNGVRSERYTKGLLIDSSEIPGRKNFRHYASVIDVDVGDEALVDAVNVNFHSFPTYFAGTDLGSFLVRQHSAQQISEPPTLALLCSVLFSVFFLTSLQTKRC